MVVKDMDVKVLASLAAVGGVGPEFRKKTGKFLFASASLPDKIYLLSASATCGGWNNVAKVGTFSPGNPSYMKVVINEELKRLGYQPLVTDVSKLYSDAIETFSECFDDLASDNWWDEDDPDEDYLLESEDDVPLASMNLSQQLRAKLKV